MSTNEAIGNSSNPVQSSTYPSDSTIINPRQPSLFIGHGSPMNALQVNEFTMTWRKLGERIRREHGTPKAILAVSAHWYTKGTAVTAMHTPKTIHDFWGFPPELSAINYPAPGAPAFAEAVTEIAKPTTVLPDEASWGLDHGTWSVLVHLFPEANVPVIQLSVDATASMDEHLALATRLNALRDQGILILGSGNVVHNLSAVNWKQPAGEQWADAFDESFHDLLHDDPSSIPSLTEHAYFQRAVPTPDHFFPALHIAGAATMSDKKPEVFNYARTMGSLSMTSYGLFD